MHLTPSERRILADRLMRLAVAVGAVVIVFVVVFAVSGCGGGSEPLEQRDTQPVQCAPHAGGGCQ